MEPTPRVLIVEDEPSLRRVLARAIAADGYEVAQAGSLASARQLLDGGGFQAAVLDVGLPDGDGLSLLSEFPPERALIVTANPDERVLARAGARRVLAKPLDLQTLRNNVRSLATWREVRRGGPKILLYSHDTFGLGNIRRTLLLAETLAEAHPDAAVLIVTGSPVIHAFRIPARVDYIKLPSLDRVAADRYEPRFLARCSDEIRQMRAAVLERTVVDFAPDLVIVDKRPGGIEGELLEPLGALRRRKPGARVVLGVRDVLDAPERTRLAMARGRWMEAIERHYDEVWVYGTQEVFDPVAEYGFSEEAAEKLQFVGYLGRPTRPRTPGDGVPRVLVTTGGGGDGSRMIETFLEGLVALPRSVALRSTVVLGPEMPGEARDRILARFGGLSDVEFCDFDPDPMLRLAQVEAVVSMAGYNTVCEILSSGCPALLVPRCEPVEEQLIRAQRLAALGCVEILEPRELSPRLLIERLLPLLGRSAGGAPPPALDGLARLGARVRALLAEEAGGRLLEEAV
jgi:predicted glycosyltransferase